MKETVSEQAFKGASRFTDDSRHFPTVTLSKEMQNALIMRGAGDSTFGTLREQLTEK